MFSKERFYEGPLFSNLKKTQFYFKSRRTQILHQKMTYNHGEQVYKKRPVSDIAGDVQQSKEHHTLTGNKTPVNIKCRRGCTRMLATGKKTKQYDYSGRQRHGFS